MQYEIYGGKRLFGELNVYGAKNAILPLLASAVLADVPTRIDNCRPLGDVKTMCEILRSLGIELVWTGQTITVYPSVVPYWEIPSLLANKIRASVLFMGALLGKYKKATIPLPGGCAIGSRPIDIHIDGLKKLGAKFDFYNDKLVVDGKNMRGNVVSLPFPSVGATENLLLCAVLTKGETRLFNCAIEPEVVQLEHALVQMGAKIEGVGTPNLLIEGVDELKGATICAIGDRVVASTYLLAVAGAGGRVCVKGFDANHCSALLGILQSAGCKLTYSDGVTIECDKIDGLGVVETAPYPAFATDVQSQLLSVATVCNGNTTIVENIFENRLVHNVLQLRRLGAQIDLNGNVATIKGAKLKGATVQSNDLRGGAGLVLAGLFADGITRVTNVSHVERGYFDIVGSLQQVGAEIKLTN